jgi:hypothetical protein
MCSKRKPRKVSHHKYDENQTAPHRERYGIDGIFVGVGEPASELEAAVLGRSTSKCFVPLRSQLAYVDTLSHADRISQVSLSWAVDASLGRSEDYKSREYSERNQLRLLEGKHVSVFETTAGRSSCVIT